MMNKLIYAALPAMLCMTAFSSCSNKEDEPATPAAKTIEGSYEGNMDCSVMGSVSTFEEMTYTVKATDESTVSVTLPACGEAPMAMPVIELTGVKVSEADGTVTLATTEVSGQTDGGKNYTCTMSGSVQGNILNIKYNLTYGAMPMPLICSSTATKK